MAAAGGSVYLPPLDKCLAGEARVISWKSAYRALSDEELAEDNSILEAFLNLSESKGVLASPFKPFLRRSPESAADFETATAPIHVSRNDDTNLDELKSDVKWLSQQMEVAELAALRVALIERQERPSDEVLAAQGFIDVAVPDPADLARSMMARSASSSVAPSSRTQRKLDVTDELIRRRRLFSTFCSERAYILRLAADLVGRAQVSKDDMQQNYVGALVHRDTSATWIDALAHATVSLMLTSIQDKARYELACIENIETIRDAFLNTEPAAERPHTIRDDEHKLERYIELQYQTICQGLRILLANIYALDGIPSADLVKKWIDAMDRCTYLQSETSLLNELELDGLIPQHLIATISAEILKAHLVSGTAMHAAGKEGIVVEGEKYIDDDRCVKAVNQHLLRCAELRVGAAAPALAAWASITSVVETIAYAHKQARINGLPPSNSDEEVPSRSSRRGSSEFYSEFEKLLESLDRPLEDAREDLSSYFMGVAVDRMGLYAIIPEVASTVASVFASPLESAIAFICKETLLDTIRGTLEFVMYNADVLEATISLLTPSASSQASHRHTCVLAGKIMQDTGVLRSGLLLQILGRYPYELSPMLRFTKAIASAESLEPEASGSPLVVEILENLKSMTQMVPKNFDAYALVHEEQDANLIQLTEAVSIFGKENLYANEPTHQALPLDQQQDYPPAFVIPAFTQGVIAKESRPLVLSLKYEHSGLEFLGLLLSTFLSSSDIHYSTPGTSQALDRGTVAEMVDLFTALLAAATKQRQGSAEAKHVLDRTSHSLPDGQDVTFVIAEIFEVELLAFLDQAPQDGSLELVIACAEFFKVLTKVSPERVWSILARSCLLGVTDGAVSLASVVGGTEAQTGQYRFLKACVELHALLLDDAIAGLVRRRGRATSSTSNRFESRAAAIDSTPKRSMSAVLCAFQRILLEVMQEIPSWNFVIVDHRLCIVRDTLNAFIKLVESTYGLEMAKAPSDRLSSVLGPAANALVSACAPSNCLNPLITAIGRLLPEGVAVAQDACPANTRRLLVEQINSIVQFLTTLVRVARSGSGLVEKYPQNTSANSIDEDAALEKRALAEEHAAVLSTIILKHMPSFAMLLASDQGYQLQIFTLLSELVQSVGSAKADPQSILGQLESSTAKAFLDVAITLGGPLSDVPVERAAWDFLATLMSHRQNWCAMYLLTATLPEDRRSLLSASPARARPLLRTILDRLSHIDHLAPNRAAGMLKFIAKAQQTWTWITSEVRSHENFLNGAVSVLNRVGADFNARQPAVALAVSVAKDYEIAGYLCDILAKNLHASLEIGDTKVLRALAPNLENFIVNAVKVDAYNRTLHRNLAENIKSKFLLSDLSDFKRTDANPAPLGDNYVYDRSFAAHVLRHDISWLGPDQKQGYSDEFARANANLSLLQSQTFLLESFKTLVTVLCECAGQQQEPTTLQQTLYRGLADVAINCVKANANAQSDEPGVGKVLELRMELAFVTISKMFTMKVHDEEKINALLYDAWALVSRSPVNYDVATALEDIRYYRRLLQVLYLTIQQVSRLKQKTGGLGANETAPLYYLDNRISACLANIVSTVIGPGFRALCGNLHNDIQLAMPADFGLLTALLQAILSVPGINTIYNHISDTVASSSIIRGALSLYSWSDQLAEITDKDPVYGEIATVFLLALSTIPPVAEQMAREGALTVLSSANLSSYFRKPGGKGPFDEPPRMFVIWSEGFLQICLNMLDAVGPLIAAEVAAFLNTFPEQLRRAEKSLLNETPSTKNPRAGTITFGLISEASSLSTIALILRSDIARAAAEGINAIDIPVLQYDLDGVRALVEGLARTRRSLNDRIRSATPLEARWSTIEGLDGNKLQRKIVREIETMLSCFGNGDS